MQGVSAVLAVVLAAIAIYATRQGGSAPESAAAAPAVRSVAIPRTYRVCCAENSRVLPVSQGGGPVEVARLPSDASSADEPAEPIRLTPDVLGLDAELGALADAASIAYERGSLATIDELGSFVKRVYGLELERRSYAERPDDPTSDGSGVPWTPILVVWGIGILLLASWWASSRRRAY